MIVLQTLSTGNNILINLKQNPIDDGLYSFFDSSDGSEIVSGSVAFSGLLTFTASAPFGAGTPTPKVVTLSSSSGIKINHTYFVGQNKITVKNINGNNVEIEETLRQQYPAGTTITEGFIYFEIPSQVVNKERRFVLRLRYSVDTGVAMYTDTGYVADWPTTNPVDIETLTFRYPSLRDIRGRQDVLENFIQSGWNIVVSRILGLGYTPEQFLGPQLTECTLTEILCAIAMGGIDPSGKGEPMEFYANIARINKTNWDALSNVIGQMAKTKANKVEGENSRLFRVTW